MKINNKIKFDSATALIEANAPGQFPRLVPAYLKIEWDYAPTVTAFTRDYNISGTPMDEWEGRADTFRLPGNVNANALRDWVDSDDFRGKLTEVIDAMEDDETFHHEKYYFEHFVETEAPTLEEGQGFWDVDQWLQWSTAYPDEGIPRCHIDDIGEITPATTDEELEAMADAINKLAIENDVVFDGDTYGWLEELRDQCAEYDDNED